MPSSCAVSTVQVKPFFDEAAPLSGEQMMAANPYRPWPARITSIIDLTETEKLFEFRLIDDRIRDAFSHEPGQFVEVSIFGVGEAPISISSSPSKRGFIELCVRRTGHFTEVLHKMQCGDIVGLRGPFGRGFPFEDMKGHDILLVAGGLGNALDRLTLGYVIDFIEPVFINFPVFNVADIGVTCGVVIFIVGLYLEHRRAARSEGDER